MKRLVLILSIAFLFLLSPQRVFAEVIHSFDSSITAYKNGDMEIVETINYDFENLQKHGIFRYIPLYSKVGDLYRVYKITNVKVTRDGYLEKFTQSGNSEETYLKIGDPKKTITGIHTYNIYYKVSNGIGSNFETHDEIYWNITGNDWKVNIEKASATIYAGFETKLTDLICFSGKVGSKTANCSINGNQVTSNSLLSSGEGLTIVASFPAGTFPKSILSKSPPKRLADKILGTIFANYHLIFIFFNLFLPILLIYWYRKHKNKKSFGKPAVNFDFPKDEKGERIAPALAGIVDTAKLERDDIVATIFDLAIRKYIKIEEVKTVRSLLPDSTEQKIIKEKKADDGTEDFEKILLERLFRDGDTVNLSDLKKDFYKTFNKIEDSLFKELIRKGYYIKNPKNQKTGLFILGMFSLFTINIVLAVVFFFLSHKLNGRTALGDEIDFKIDGLKLFLKSMDRNYKWQAEKFYTVEHMIPFAIALGYIDRFLEALKILKPDYDPVWYSGSNAGFYTGIALFSVAASSSITTASPSSSGAGGGGFSGGGGGGGGGGSW